MNIEKNKSIKLDEWKSVVSSNFPDLVFPAEIGLSVMSQLLIKDIKNPFALVYVDVPSSGKTITLNFFSDLKDLIYTTDNFTPASFVSHSANTKKEKLGETDMLPKIKNKTLVIRDFAPVFAKRDEDVQAMLGILIRVLDGEGLETNSGLYGKRGYTGNYNFCMLSASTPIRPRIWRMMGNLGSRLFFVNLESKEKDEKDLIEQLKKPCREKELLCRKATSLFVERLWKKYPKKIKWDIEQDDEDSIEVVVKLSKLLARLRSSINSDKQDYESQNQTITEMPDRILQLLYNLARGHALICDRKKINKDDLKIVFKVAIDSAPANRSNLVKALISKNGVLSTDEACFCLNSSKTTALHEMETLNNLKIVNFVNKQGGAGRPERAIKLKEEFNWLLENKFKLNK